MSTSAAFLAPVPITLRPLSTSYLHPARPGPPLCPRPYTRPCPRLFTMALTASHLLERARADTALLLRTAAHASAALALIAALSLPLPSLAATGGGRIGGSSFRAPRPSAPRSVAPRPGPSYGYGYGYGAPYGSGFGGGLAMPALFLSPLGGLGGGLAPLLLFGAAAAFLSSSSSSRSRDSSGAIVDDDPPAAVTVLKVALLASARPVQLALDGLARSADTTTPSGLKYVLDETLAALLRRPDYWTHASISVRAPRLSGAEAAFSDAALRERLTLRRETLSNARGRVVETPEAAAEESDLAKAPTEYIVVALVVAAAGNLVSTLPKNIDGPPDVERALKALAGVGVNSLQAVEVVWAPQSLRDTLTFDELVQDHPELRRL